MNCFLFVLLLMKTARPTRTKLCGQPAQTASRRSCLQSAKQQKRTTDLPKWKGSRKRSEEEQEQPTQFGELQSHNLVCEAKGEVKVKLETE